MCCKRYYNKRYYNKRYMDLVNKYYKINYKNYIFAVTKDYYIPYKSKMKNVLL